MTRSQRFDYYELEGFRPGQRPEQKAKLGPTSASVFSKAWSAFWEAVLKTLTANRDPMIHEKRDRRGNVYYDLYDPVGNQRLTFSSEEEIRYWLEQRYYV